MSAAEIRERYTGISAAAMFEDVESRFGRKLPADFAAILYRRNEALFEAELEAIAGVAALIDALPCPACVASSSEPERLAHTLGLTGLYDRFAPNVFSAVQVANGKPAPDLFLFAAHEMGAAASACVVVEDSIAGVRAGVAAGMTVLGFCGGGHCGPGHGARLLAEGAAAVFDHMDELAKLFDSRSLLRAR
jgi:HAD superfamily hydrolase (TIGR01509 family)